jgi:ABC-type transport system involved in multi-copper enzyme maturation permease subunit
LRSPARTPFGAIFQTEVLLNSKRVAPYAMAVLFGANAWLWQAKGPAVYYGWATNSDFVIVRIFAVFSFMTLPLFTALIMGDPVIRDFRAGVDPLIFSKPIGNATYLLGKFFGNFFVLVCCQMAFLLMLLLLQGFPTTQMIVGPARLIPYLKHFLLLVVISHLVLAAFYFTVGTLTRNAKIVYGLAVSFYPLYMTYQAVLLKSLPRRWRIALDPLLMNWPDLTAKGRGGEWINAQAINQLAFSYNSDVTANRALMVLIAAVCLTLLYVRFSRAGRFKKSEDDSRITTLNLAASDGGLFAGAAGFGFAPPARVEEDSRGKMMAIPKVSTSTEGVRANVKQLMAALGIELRLLYAERSLVVLVPLATLLCLAGLAYYEVAPDGSYSAAYASRTAESRVLFILAIAVF